MVVSIGFVFGVTTVKVVVSILGAILIQDKHRSRTVLAALTNVIIILVVVVPRVDRLFSAIGSLFSL